MSALIIIGSSSVVGCWCHLVPNICEASKQCWQVLFTCNEWWFGGPCLHPHVTQAVDSFQVAIEVPSLMFIACCLSMMSCDQPHDIVTSPLCQLNPCTCYIWQTLCCIGHISALFGWPCNGQRTCARWRSGMVGKMCGGLMCHVAWSG